MSEPSIGDQNGLARESSTFIVRDDEVSFLDLLVVLAKHKKLVIGLPFIAAIVGVAISLLLPNIYVAATTILPPQQSQSSAAAMLAQLGQLGGLAGGLAATKNPNDLYVGMLKSRTVADNIIDRFKLHRAFEQKFRSGTRLVLADMTQIASRKDGIITIEVEDKDPKRAADLANAYVDELRKLTSVLAITEASQRRLFFEQQFVSAKDNLAKAEITARQAMQQGGLVKVDEQGRALIETSGRLRGQITVKEVQIGAMRTFAADNNPDLRLAQQELEALKRELAKTEGTGSAKAAEGASGGKGIDNVRLLRNLKYYETIYELLAKQYEMAKIDEAKDSAVIQVMDSAIEPDRKAKPKRALIVVFFAFAALCFAIVWAFVSETMAKVGGNPDQADRLAALKRHLAWR